MYLAPRLVDPYYFHIQRGSTGVGSFSFKPTKTHLFIGVLIVVIAFFIYTQLDSAEEAKRKKIEEIKRAIKRAELIKNHQQVVQQKPQSQFGGFDSSAGELDYPRSASIPEGFGRDSFREPSAFGGDFGNYAPF